MKNFGTKKISFANIVIITLIALFIMFISTIVDVNESEAHAESAYTETPVITILTHGLGGSPKDQSNNNYFYNGSY